MDVVFGVSGWWLIPVLAAGIIYASLLYFRNKQLPFSKPLVAGLFFLRLTAVSLIAFLLLTPYLKQKQKVIEQPIVLLAQDNSASVRLGRDSILYQKDTPSVFENIKQLLAEKLAVQSLTFDANVIYDGAVDFSGQRTDFSALLKTTATDYFNRNVGALVVLSDGIANSGIPAALLAGDYPFPVYTLALGDTLQYPDLAVADVRYNKMVYQQSDFPVEISVKCQGAQGKSVQIELLHEGKVLASAEQKSGSRKHIITQHFVVKAPAEGRIRLTARVKALDDERLTRNNETTFYLDVVNQKRKVLLLAHAPHPDLGVIQTVLSLHFDVNMNIVPAAVNINENYSLIILHGLPSKNTDHQQLKQLLQQQLHTPVLFILDQQTEFSVFNAIQSGVKLLSAEKSLWVPATAVTNPGFTLFSMDKVFLDRLIGFPAINVPLAEYQPAANFYPFLDQQIKGVKTTYPLIGFAGSPDRMQAYIFGTGIWRWRLADFQMNNNHQAFNDLIGKLVQYMLVVRDDKRLRIFHEDVFMLSDELVFRAEYYNQSMQKINGVPLKIEFKHEETGNIYNYAFAPGGDEYMLNAGRLPAGNYRYQAELTEGDAKLSASGSFLIEAFSLEGLSLEADHAMLSKLSNETGGKMFFPGQEAKLAEAISNNPAITSVSYHSDSYERLVNLPLLLLLILLLLGLEWFLRKYNGQY